MGEDLEGNYVTVFMRHEHDRSVVPQLELVQSEQWMDITGPFCYTRLETAKPLQQRPHMQSGPEQSSHLQACAMEPPMQLHIPRLLTGHSSPV